MTEHSRKTGLVDWLSAVLPGQTFELTPASADASFRSYWRVRTPDNATRIVMDAPPDKEDVRPWLDVARRLADAGVHSPEVFAVDAVQGFLLLEDLGNRTFLPELDHDSVHGLYGQALDALATMQVHADCTGLPDYDEARLVAEMELMPEWFLRRHLGWVPSCDQWDVFELAFRRLTENAREQPQVFVHRDFHSRNLLITAQNGPGVIDFQDAVRGPVTYDLVSLLRDCYIEWPIERVDGWVESYRQRLVHAGSIAADARRFRRWFDLMGIQRHLKVLGIFCRLWYRDGKAGYLADLPLVWRYTLDVMALYSEFDALRELLERVVDGRDLAVIAPPHDHGSAR
jgi:aminoglycoside/choline kinase family phosphotransferase